MIREKIMTHGKQYAETDFVVEMEGAGSTVNLISRSVAREHSRQLFKSRIVGNGRCQGHSECDAIIMDEASVSAIPELTANNIDANLIHEAAIGKIAGEQLIKLMTLGLTEKEAEALFCFQINGCFAVSKQFSNLEDREWCPVQNVIDRFIKGGISSFPKQTS